METFMNRSHPSWIPLSVVAVAALLVGCARSQPAVSMAPPIQAAPPQSNGTVWNWRDVPKDQRIPIVRGVFDQGGYQLYAKTGETIVVPFENENLYAMKFGQTSSEMEFVNDGQAPVLYLQPGMSLENATAQGAKWYPFSEGQKYERPVYVGLAPSWADYLAMGWYANMVYRGGYWGYSPWHPGFMGYSPMVGLNINVGGRSYGRWDDYRGYYRNNTVGRTSVRPAYNYRSVGRRAPSSFGRSTGAGSFGTGSARPSTSFGSRPSMGTGPSTGFGRPSGGSFGSGTSGYRARPSSGGGLFGSRPSSGGGFFGRSSGGSFGRSSGGFGGFGGRRR
jgi:hypothetical protein